MSKLQTIIESADKFYNSGCNCAEGITTAFQKAYPEQIDVCIIPMSSNFGGGIASGCVCGALAGATMVIGALSGRTCPQDKPKSEVMDLSKEFIELAKSKLNSCCCSEIKVGDLGATGEYANCTRVITTTAKILAEFLASKNLIKI